MLMEVRELQILNAPSPMLVTLSGITRLLKEVQPSNAQSPVIDTPSRRTRLCKELQNKYLLLVDYQYYTL